MIKDIKEHPWAIKSVITKLGFSKKYNKFWIYYRYIDSRNLSNKILLRAKDINMLKKHFENKDLESLDYLTGLFLLKSNEGRRNEH